MTIQEIRANRAAKGLLDSERAAVIDWRFALSVGDTVYVSNRRAAGHVIGASATYVTVSIPGTFFTASFSRRTGKRRGMNGYITPEPQPIPAALERKE